MPKTRFLCYMLHCFILFIFISYKELNNSVTNRIQKKPKNAVFQKN